MVLGTVNVSGQINPLMALILRYFVFVALIVHRAKNKHIVFPLLSSSLPISMLILGYGFLFKIFVKTTWF